MPSSRSLLSHPWSRFFFSAPLLAALLTVPCGATPEIAVYHPAGVELESGRVTNWGSATGGLTPPAAARTGVASVAARNTHSVAIKADGSVLAWGTATGGQTTVPAAAQTGVAAISIGSSHTLFLKSDGTVGGWGGSNFSGQRTIPVAAQSGVTAIAAGGNHSLALKNGGVVSWGSTSSGLQNVPPDLSAGVVAIAAGGQHSVALKAGGQVVVWGSNASGQLNVPESARTGVKVIAAGEQHTLAVKQDGTVVAWGGNTGGQSNPPAGLAAVRAVAGGSTHSLALREDGTVAVWGTNTSVTSTIPSSLAEVISIAAGSVHSLAVTHPVVTYSNQTVGTDSPAKVFTVKNSGSSVLSLQGVTFSGEHAGDFRIVSAAPPGSLAQAGGTASFSVVFNPAGEGPRRAVMHVGSDDGDEGDYQIILKGTGLLPDIFVWPEDRLLPDAGGLRNGSEILVLPPTLSGSASHAQTYEVINWGKGILSGLSVALAGNDAAEFSVSQPPVMTLAANTSTTFTIRFTPSFAGEKAAILRIASNDPDEAPFVINVKGLALDGPDLQVETQEGAALRMGWLDGMAGHRPPPLLARSGLIDADMGESIYAALRNDGTPVLWGYYNDGIRNIRAAAPASAGTDGRQIGCGKDFTAMLKRDGRVVVWGANTYGITAVPLSAQSGVVAISVGYEHILALREDGTMVAWGLPEDGRLDVPPDARNGIVAVAAGTRHSSALRSDGRVVLWGAASSGVPVSQIPARAGSGIASLSSGWDILTARTQTGNAFSWNVAADTLFLERSGVSSAAAVSGSVRYETAPGSFSLYEFPQSQPSVESGLGQAPEGPTGLGLNSDIVSFPPTQQGAPPSGRTLILRNTGHTPLHIGGIELDGRDPQDFSLDTTATALVIPPAGSTPLTIRFSPRFAGYSKAALRVLSNDHDEPRFTIPLAGTGLGGELSIKDQPQSGQTPQTLDFGTIHAGQGPVTRQITFRNSGTGQITGLTVSGLSAGPFSSSALPSAALAVDGTISFNVSFSPSAAGTFSETLEISSDRAADGRIIFSLRGAAISSPEVEVRAAGTGELIDDGGVTGWSNHGPLTNIPAELRRGVRQVAAVGEHNLALLSSGKVVAWGSPLPPPVPAWANSAGSGIQSIATADAGSFGSPYSLALKADGSVAGWGSNQYGTLSFPAEVSSGVTAISAGMQHVLALKAGKVIAWGEGTGAAVPPAALSGIIAISAGRYHSLALRENGEVITWGGGSFPGLSDVPIGAKTGVVGIAAGWAVSAALKSDGSAVSWGDNLPSPPQGTIGVTSIACGRGSCLAVKSDGSVTGWGDLIGPQYIRSQHGVYSLAAANYHTLALSRHRTNFPDQRSGTISAPSSLLLRNTGSAPLTFGGFDLSGRNTGAFLISAPAAGTQIPAGGQATVEVRFHPADTGDHSAILALNSNDSDEGRGEIALSGMGVIPRILVFDGPAAGSALTNGASLDFGSIFPGRSSQSRLITIRNAGSEALTGISITGAAGAVSEFAVTEAPPAALAPGAEAAVRVEFRPSGTGGRMATYRISSNDPALGSFDLLLGGTGLAAPELTVEPAAKPFSFGPARLGTAAAGKHMTLRNTGNLPLVVSSAVISGGEPGEFSRAIPGLPLTLQPGESGGGDLLFVPAQTGVRTALLNIGHNAGDTQLPLSGTGVAPDVQVFEGDRQLLQPEERLNEGSAAIFPSSMPGSPASGRTFSIRNAGSAVLENVSVSIAPGSASADFALVTPPAAVLEAGAATEFYIQFTPSSAGTRRAELIIQSDDPDEPVIHIGLDGRGESIPLISVSSGGTELPFKVTAVAGSSSGSPATLDQFGRLSNYPDIPGAAMRDVVQFAQGSGFILVVKNDGTLYRWGTAPIGSSPVPAEARTSVTAVAAGETHAVVLRTDGRVVCWGDGTDGKTTVPAEALTGVTAISAGQNHTLALKANGRVLAWGRNASGECTVPAEALSGVLKISAGGGYSLAIGSAGQVLHWGYDFGVAPALPRRLAGRTFKAISAGWSHSAVLTTQGDVFAWGSNFYNQSGGADGASGIHDISTTINATRMTRNPHVSYWTSSTETKSFRIENKGNQALTITGAALSGPHAGQFQISQASFPVTLPPSAAISFNVSFNPLSSELVSQASITITSDDLVRSAYVIDLSGTNPGIPGMFVFEGHQTLAEDRVLPDGGPVVIPDAVPGIPREIVFTIQNKGFAALQVSPPRLEGDPEFTLSGSPILSPVALSSDRTLKIPVQFLPAAPGVRNTVLVIPSNDPVLPEFRLPLRGAGLAGPLCRLSAPDGTLYPDRQALGWRPPASTVDVLANGATCAEMHSSPGALVVQTGWPTFPGFSNYQLSHPRGLYRGVSDFSYNDYAALALSPAGEVNQWGSGAQLLHRPVETDAGVESISQGIGFALALKEGKVIAWGSNAWGQCSVPAEARTGVSMVSAGFDHSLALTRTGKVIAWGGNQRGQANVPLQATADIVSVAAAAYYSLALTATGQVIAWGDQESVSGLNPAMMTGISQITRGSFALNSAGGVVDMRGWSPVPALLAEGISRLSFGQGCAAIRNAAVDFGSFPTGPSGLTRPFIVENTGSSSLEVTGLRFESGDAGQFATPAQFPFAVAPGQSAQLPIVFAPTSSATKQARFSILCNDITRASIPLFLTGSGRGGEISVLEPVAGSGAVELQDGGAAAPFAADPLRYSSTRRFSIRNMGNAPLTGVSLSVNPDGDSADFSATLLPPGPIPPGATSTMEVEFHPLLGGTRAGTLKIYSSDADEPAFQISLTGVGIPRPEIEVAPVESADAYGKRVVAWTGAGEELVPAEADGAIQIARGNSHAIALTGAGQAICWGDNSADQCNAPALSGLLSVSAGGRHSLAINAGGSVLGWGSNQTGQVTIPQEASSGVIRVAAGAWHSLALTSAGSVIGWGDNSAGQSAVPVEARSGVRDIAAGAFHSMALKQDGRVLVWGEGGQGQLNVPAQIKGVRKIAAGWAHCMALLADGSVSVWGDSSRGQTSVPAIVRNVRTISAGAWHCAAVQEGGTSITWGNSPATGTVPGIAAGAWTVAAGGQSTMIIRNSVGFGGSATGVTARPRFLKIANRGSLPLVVSLGLAGRHPGDFAIQSGVPGGSLQPLEEMAVGISFTPTAAGDRSAVLRIDSNDADEPVTEILLAGTGLPLGGVGLWRLQHFGTPSASGSSADAADPFGTGVPNLLAYAFSQTRDSPQQARISALPRVQALETGLGFRIPRGQIADDVLLSAEKTDDLGAENWIPVPDSGGALHYEFVIQSAPARREFLRLRVLTP